MTHRKRRRPQPPPIKRPSGQLPGTPSLTELERFSDAGLRQWRRGWEHHREIYSELYFGLERQRAEHAAELADALLRNTAQPLALQGWARIVDCQYSLTPLSIAGSLSHEGGRFNIGRRLNPSAFPPFGAIYLADSHETAFAEKFGIRSNETRDGLTAHDLVLRAPTSHTFYVVEGLLEHYLDLVDHDALDDFVRVIAKFKTPERAIQLSRTIQKIPPSIIRTASTLRSHLMHPDWNIMPMHFGLPSNSQIFGRLAHATGFHGIAYPSVRGPGRCLALYPDNWSGSRSEIHIVDKTPPGARLLSIDGTTPVFE